MKAMASDAETEIQHLLTTVAESPCSFIRNGTTYSAEEAAAHLSTKYSRGKAYVRSTQQFIDRIASKSSLSAQPYRIRCPGTGHQTTRAWLTEQLQTLRNAKIAGQR